MVRITQGMARRQSQMGQVWFTVHAAYIILLIVQQLWYHQPCGMRKTLRRDTGLHSDRFRERV